MENNVIDIFVALCKLQEKATGVKSQFYMRKYFEIIDNERSRTAYYPLGLGDAG